MSTEPITQAELEAWKELEAKAKPTGWYADPVDASVRITTNTPHNIVVRYVFVQPWDFDKHPASGRASAELASALRNNALRLFSAAEECGRLRKALSEQP